MHCSPKIKQSIHLIVYGHLGIFVYCLVCIQISIGFHRTCFICIWFSLFYACVFSFNFLVLVCVSAAFCVSIRMSACFGSVLFSLQQNPVCCVVLVWLAYLSDCLFMRSIPIWRFELQRLNLEIWFDLVSKNVLQEHTVFFILNFFLLDTCTSFLGCKSIFLNHLKLLLDPVLFPLTINSAPRVKQNIRCLNFRWCVSIIENIKSSCKCIQKNWSSPC